LRRAGLPQGLADQPRVLLSTEEFFALWRAVGEVSTNPAIGLLLGTETRTERFQPMGLAALSTESLGSAVQQMARYKQMVVQCFDMQNTPLCMQKPPSATTSGDSNKLRAQKRSGPGN